MDGPLIENAKLVLRSPHVPPKLVGLINSYYLQSSTSIPLKPNQEPARAHLCSVLAVEQLGEKLNLPLPDTRNPPIQPNQYTKLLQQFRSVLCPSAAAASLPSTPSKPKRSARARAVSDLRVEMDEYEGEDDDEFSDQYELSDSESPRKRPPSSSANVTPRKSPRKSRSATPNRSSPVKAAQSPASQVNLFSNSPSKASPSKKKVSPPTPDLIDAIGVRMSLDRKTIDAVKFAHGKYLDLVKDVWGLVYGLFVVIAERAEPKVGIEHERRLVKSMGELAPRVEVDREEWINWVNKIVTGQSWIMEIAPEEPQPVLAGSAGEWFQPV